MCGICGWITRRDGPDRTEWVRRMTDGLAHRGPDDAGVAQAEAGPLAATFGHRRLSILDLTEAGHQPMRRGHWTVTYNGELYNAPELRRELEGHACDFRSHCDTEVLCFALDVWGIDALHRLNGMFAFAAADGERVHLVRDRLGIKPLYWWRPSEHELAFASELPVLAGLPGFDRTMDAQAVDHYLTFGHVPAPLCIYQNCGKLPPGTRLEVDVKGTRLQRYWAPNPEATATFDGSEQEALDELERLLAESTRTRRLSDVPLGAFLSGGIDSSLVCALAQRDMDQPLRTFSIAFSQDNYDESAHAQQIAKHIGTCHTTIPMSEREMLAIVPKIPALYGEPFADASALPTYLLCEKARGHVTVALSGDGGDEQFFGYRRYAESSVLRTIERMPAAARLCIGSAAERVFQSVPWVARRAKALSYRQFDEAALLFFGYFHRVFFYELTGRDFDIEASPFHRWFEELSEHRKRIEEIGPLLDMRFYLPEDVLCKVDRASMAHALEVRVPLLDHRVAEFANRLPHRLKCRSGEQKHLLKQLLAKYVPPHLWNRPKQGFSAPLEHWFKDDLRELLLDTLSEETLSGHPLFRRAFVRRCMDDHLTGRKDNQHYLWTLLVFELWRREQGAQF